jgi:hypothetical protein
VKPLSRTAKIFLSLWVLLTLWQLWSLTRIEAQACAYAYTAERYAAGSRDITVRPCP